MLTSNSHALKEWAAIVDAMDRGQQTVIIRKGGIAEEAGRFEVEQREFFLYPTYLHQSLKIVQPQYHQQVRPIVTSVPDASEVTISHYALVEEVLRIKDLPTLEALAPSYIMTPEYVATRLRFKLEQPLQLLLVRVFRLPQACDIPVRSGYLGCKSWVQLEEPLPTVGAVPVLDDAEFAKRAGFVRQVLSPAVVG